jgi:serine/threonine protein kinase/Tol biopolymer transport system component
MTLTAGTKLGAYEILAPLGAGGMGEVYRARDPRLGRDVAIKVLPAGYSSDAERLRRFEQEARATAALNHPNILAVFDVGRQEDGSPYIVSELLEGESLRARLRAGALPVRKAVEYALQILHGLAAAHDRGIFHRDLKPENIFVTREGHLKILDFGLAKLTQPVAASGTGMSVATLDSATGQGMAMGTLGYMSPEQLRGAPSDSRSDLFSFGAVLYEMLSGQRAFRGETTADTISAVLRAEPPDLTATGRDVPPILERIVRHCLEKDPAARFQSTRDVAFDLESLSTSSSSALPAVSAGKPRKAWLVPGLMSATAVLLLIGGLLLGRWSSSSWAPPEYHQLTFAREGIGSARFAPDHRTVIYSSARDGGDGELFSVTPDSLAPVSLGLKDTDIESISPAGEMLLIQQRRTLYAYARVGVLGRAPMTGGAPRPILNDVQDADWGPGSEIAVARYVDGHYRLEYPAGHVLYETGGYVSDVHVSPKGDLVAFAEHPTFGDDGGTIAVVDSSGRKRTLSAPQAKIMGLAWDPLGKEIRFSGSDAGLAVQLKSTDLSGHSRVVARVPGILAIHDIAPDGRVLLRHETQRDITAALGPDQNQERDLTITDWTLPYTISPDGRQVLLGEEGTGSRPGYDIYVRPTDGSAPVRIGEGEGRDFSPDMKWALATLPLRVPRQFFLIPLGPGDPRQITRDSIDHTDARFLPDGKGIVFTGIEPGHKARIYTQAIGSSSPRAISPEGVTGVVPTADGKFVFGFSDTVALYPVGGQGTPRAVPGVHPGDFIASVSPDGRSVLVVSVLHHLSLNVFRVDLASGRRELFKKIGPPDLAGLYMFPNGTFTPDGKYYAYAYSRILSELYAVDGLR